MIFWDSSALVHLLFEQGRHKQMRETLLRDPAMLVWWGSLVECGAALGRLEREGSLTSREVNQAQLRLKELRQRWVEISPSDSVLDLTFRLTRLHPLKAADSLQLAAALLISKSTQAPLKFLSFDQQLLNIAEKEGLELELFD